VTVEHVVLVDYIAIRAKVQLSAEDRAFGALMLWT